MIARLVQARLEQGLTRRELAARMGYYAGNMSRWENEQSCPNFRALNDWAMALGFHLVLEPLQVHSDT